MSLSDRWSFVNRDFLVVKVGSRDNLISPQPEAHLDLGKLVVQEREIIEGRLARKPWGVHGPSGAPPSWYSRSTLESKINRCESIRTVSKRNGPLGCLDFPQNCDSVLKF